MQTHLPPCLTARIHSAADSLPAVSHSLMHVAPTLHPCMHLSAGMLVHGSSARLKATLCAPLPHPHSCRCASMPPHPYASVPPTRISPDDLLPEPPRPACSPANHHLLRLHPHRPLNLQEGSLTVHLGQQPQEWRGCGRAQQQLCARFIRHAAHADEGVATLPCLLGVHGANGRAGAGAAGAGCVLRRLEIGTAGSRCGTRFVVHYGMARHPS